MKLKEIHHTAMPSWSPAQHHPIYLATGTSAHQLDASFSTSASLEFFKLDLADPSLDMTSCGSFPTSHRYHKLVWSPHGLGGESHPSGVLIAGGENGNVILYDPAKIMSRDSDVVIAQSDIHTGPVRALDINPFQTNLVASGGNESEIYIWDMNNFGSPMTPGPKTQPLEDISCVAWNRQVQHILSSSSPSGRTSVWDLRKNDLIIKVSDHSNRMHCSGMAWNPEVATQLVVASEDDRMPVIQMWDLRFATSPLKILENHTRGVLAIAWSLADPDLLLSCGKDSRILCWNPNTGEVLYELPTTNQWCFDIQWCPRNPAVLSAAGFDGYINIHSIMGGTSQAQNQRNVDHINTAFGNMDPFGTGQTLPPLQMPQSTAPPATVNPLKKPPKWIRRPVGASFAFGGKLVSMENPKPGPQQTQQPAPPVVHVSQVVTETTFLKRSDQLQATLGSGNFVEFCLEKIDTAENAFEKTVWSFLKANFDSDTRSSFLELLGYNKEEVALKISAALTEKPAEVETPAPCDALPIAEPIIAPPAVSPEAVFDLIAASNVQPPSSLELNLTPKPESKETLQINYEEKMATLNDPIGETNGLGSEGVMEKQEEEEIVLEEITGPVEEPSADILAPSEEALMCPTEEALQSPFEEIIQDASEQAPQCPIEEALMYPTKEALQCPIEEPLLCPTKDALPTKESLMSPMEDALMCPTQDALQSPFEEVLQVPSEDASHCLVRDILQCSFDEILQDTSKEAIMSPSEEALTKDAVLSPSEEVLQVPSQEVPQCPIEEEILCPSVDVLQSPFEEVNQNDALLCPLEDQCFSEELLNTCEDVSKCPSEVVPCPFDEIVQCPVEEAPQCIFDDLVNPSEEVSMCPSEGPVECPSLAVAEAPSEEVPQIVAPAESASISKDVDGLITQALLTGDFEGAVELCLHDNRMADSIILAIAGGTDLLQKTQAKYFTKTHSKLTKLISAVVMKDWHDILNTCELQNWREALAAVMTYSQPQEFTSLCDLLGARLEAANDSQLQAQACLCYICAGNVEKLVSCWTKAQAGSNPLSLQDLVEKVVVMRRAVEQTQSSGPVVIGVLLAEKMSQYANLLASQGSLATALTYLPEGTDQICVQQLRERLSYALGQKTAVPASNPPSQTPQSQPQSQPQPVPAQPTHPYAPVQPTVPAPAPAQPQYYQPVRAATTVTSWSNQTPTAFPHMPTPLPISTAPDQPQVEHPNPVYGMPAPGSAAASPSSTAPSYMYSQQYQPYSQVQPQYPPQGGVSVYHPLQQFTDPSSPPPPPPPGFIPQYSVQSQAAYPPPQNTFSPNSNQPFFPTSSAASFQPGGPGSPISLIPPPPIGFSGTEHDPELTTASQRTGLHETNHSLSDVVLSIKAA